VLFIQRVGRVCRFTVDELRFRSLRRKYKQYTMIPVRPYVGNLHLAAKVKGVEGIVVECGTWRGGMIAGIADVLGGGRSYYLCDSYQGLPAPQEIDGTRAKAYQADTTNPLNFNNCAASEEEARAAMSMSSAKDYHIVKGWFEETLPKLPSYPIALLRMDADWYASTKCILDNLADRVVSGGMIIIDDYCTWEGCTAAVNEFAARKRWPLRESHHGVYYLVV
jgi:O-methyltransferase